VDSKHKRKTATPTFTWHALNTQATAACACGTAQQSWPIARLFGAAAPMAYFQVGDLKVGLFAVLVAVLTVLVSVALTQVDQIKSPPLIVWVMRLGVPLLRTVKRRSACQPVRAFVRALVTIVHLARVGQTRPIFDRRLRVCVSVPVTGVSPVAHSVAQISLCICARRCSHSLLSS
jgi:hypothetical protein